MLDNASRNLLFEHLRTQPCAHLPLQWQAPFRCIHNARYPYGIHSLRSSAQSQHEFIHHKARVHARADQSHAPGFRLLIQLRRQIRIFAVGIGELLARRDHAGFRSQACGQLIHYGG